MVEGNAEEVLTACDWEGIKMQTGEITNHCHMSFCHKSPPLASFFQVYRFPSISFRARSCAVHVVKESHAISKRL